MALGSYRTGSGLRISAILAEYGDKAAAAMGKALYQEAQGILSAAVQLTPVDTGTLRSSGYVTEPEQIGSTIHVEVGFGGPAAKINPKTGESSESYAIFVHENLEAHHPVGSAKYLELPFNAATRGMSGRIADFMNRELGGMNIGPEGPVVDYEDVVMA